MTNADAAVLVGAVVTVAAMAACGVYVIDLDTGATIWWLTVLLYTAMAMVSRFITTWLIVKAGRIDWFI